MMQKRHVFSLVAVCCAGFTASPVFCSYFSRSHDNNHNTCVLSGVCFSHGLTMLFCCYSFYSIVPHAEDGKRRLSYAVHCSIHYNNVRHSELEYHSEFRTLNRQLKLDHFIMNSPIFCRLRHCVWFGV